MTENVVAIHQPQYLSWVPYFDKILQSDMFVLLDNVQFQKNGLQNRNQIKTKDGLLWLSIPVQHHFGQLISETCIADRKATRRHVKTLEMAYKKSPFYSEIGGLIFPVLNGEIDNLSDLNCELIKRILCYLDYKGEIRRASTLEVNGKGSDLVLNVCKRLRATTYLSGVGGKNYMNLDDFARDGIVVRFQRYQNVAYPQLNGDFVGDLSIIDLLFNQGKGSLKTIQQGRLW